MGNLEGSTISFYVKMLNPESLADVCGRKRYTFMNLLLIFILWYENMDMKATTIIMVPKPKLYHHISDASPCKVIFLCVAYLKT
jgi:hypothetical protein